MNRADLALLRNVVDPCLGCDGLGVKTYGNTSTWRGGIGGSMMTTDVCNRCWGSGDAGRPWPDWRKTEAAIERLRKIDAKIQRQLTHQPTAGDVLRRSLGETRDALRG